MLIVFSVNCLPGANLGVLECLVGISVFSEGRCVLVCAFLCHLKDIRGLFCASVPFDGVAVFDGGGVIFVGCGGDGFYADLLSVFF